MNFVSELMELLRAVHRAVVSHFASEPTMRVVEVRPHRTEEGWEAVREGRDYLFLEGPTEDSIVRDMTQYLRWNGGGEVVVVGHANRITKRIWVTPSRQPTQIIEKGEWSRDRHSGWTHFCNVPSDFGVADDSNRELIDLLKALIGPANVATGGAYVDGTLAEDGIEMGIFVLCSHRDLERLKKSERWFRLASPGEGSSIAYLEGRPRVYTLAVGPATHHGELLTRGF